MFMVLKSVQRRTAPKAERNGFGQVKLLVSSSKPMTLDYLPRDAGCQSNALRRGSFLPTLATNSQRARPRRHRYSADTR
jgi:hypothetical protein